MTVCDLAGPYVYDTNIQILYTTAVVDVFNPTETEITGSTNLTTEYCLTDIIGWEIENEIIVNPPFGTFAIQRPGMKRLPRAPQLVFTADRVGNDIRTLLAEDDEGFMLFLPSGLYADYPTAPVHVFPVTVAQITQRQTLRLDSSLLIVTFAVSSVVGENVVVV